METAEGKRRYQSKRRDQHAAETRRTVLDAAAELFADRGWAGTGMRDVARAAGVSVETVYAHFGSKPALLKATLDIAVVGDDRDVPLAQRPDFHALGAGTRSQRARAAASLVRQVNDRTYRIRRVLREAAASDADLDRQVHELEQRRRADVEDGATLVAGRPVTATERDGLWAVLSLEVFQLLIDRAGWSATEYEDWLADTIVRLLLPATKERR